MGRALSELDENRHADANPAPQLRWASWHRRAKLWEAKAPSAVAPMLPRGTLPWNRKVMSWLMPRFFGPTSSRTGWCLVASVASVGSA